MLLRRSRRPRVKVVPVLSSESTGFPFTSMQSETAHRGPGTHQSVPRSCCFAARKGLPAAPAHPPASLGPPLRRPCAQPLLHCLPARARPPAPSLIRLFGLQLPHFQAHVLQGRARVRLTAGPPAQLTGGVTAARMKPFPSQMINSCSIFKASCHRVLGHHAWAHDCPKGTQPALLCGHMAGGATHPPGPPCGLCVAAAAPFPPRGCPHSMFPAPNYW